jgi:hypothetical protein
LTPQLVWILQRKISASSPGIEPQFSCRGTRSLVTIQSWYFSYKFRNMCRSLILHTLRTDPCSAVLTNECFTSQIDPIHFVLVFALLRMSFLFSIYFRISRARSETSVTDIRRGNGPGANLNSKTTPIKCLLSQLLCLFNDTVSTSGCYASNARMWKKSSWHNFR